MLYPDLPKFLAIQFDKGQSLCFCIFMIAFLHAKIQNLIDGFAVDKKLF